MNSEDIRCFQYLAETLNFTKAAERAYMSQPVFSRRILSLEKELGVKLFERNSKTVKLTSAGLLFSDGFKDLMHQYKGLLDSAATMQEGYSGTLAIGALSGQLISNFLPLIDGYRRDHPDIRLTILARDLGKLRHLLLEGRLDFVYGAKAEFDFIPNFAYKLMPATGYHLVVRRGHPLAQRPAESLRFSDFREETFLVFPEEESHTQHKNLFIRSQKASFTPKMCVVPDLASMALWIEAGLGVAILNENSILFGNPNLQFLSLHEITPADDAVFWNRDCRSPKVLRFAEYIQAL